MSARRSSTPQPWLRTNCTRFERDACGFWQTWSLAETIEFLNQLGHEAIHVRSLGLQRAPDPDLVERARANGSILVTFDLDFGDILALGVLDKPCVIIFRLADERADSVNQRLAVVLTERHVDLESGALILVEDTRYRMRKLTIGSV
jgi:predicted nuclease of predicted toxin-antitoxin system